jgi:hypothetical protein
VREEFGEGNQFCKKITSKVEDAKSVLSAFRNDYYPSAATPAMRSASWRKANWWVKPPARSTANWSS